MLAIAVVLLELVGCVDSHAPMGAAGGSVLGDSNDDGCPPGEQPVFGPDGSQLVCSPVPHWPPQQTGSRAAPAACVLPDGAWRVVWHSDVVEPIRPAFSVTRLLTIAGDAMTLDEYRYNLQWVDAATANVWEPGDSDTWEFYVRLDCESGELVGSRTVTLPYPNPGHQVETWTFTGTP